MNRATTYMKWTAYEKRVLLNTVVSCLEQGGTIKQAQRYFAEMAGVDVSAVSSRWQWSAVESPLHVSLAKKARRENKALAAKEEKEIRRELVRLDRVRQKTQQLRRAWKREKEQKMKTIVTVPTGMVPRHAVRPTQVKVDASGVVITVRREG